MNSVLKKSLTISRNFLFSLAIVSGASVVGGFSLHPSFAAEKPEPRKVSKYYQDEIPKGMYLFTTNAGEKWLLPKGMTEAPKREIEVNYFKPDKGTPAPKVIGKIGSHEILNRPLAAEDTFVDDDILDSLPKPFANVIRKEKELNVHAENSVDLQSLGRFSPIDEETFYLPYIPIPQKDFDYAYVSPKSNASTKRLVEFTKGGVKYYRLFIHPNYPDRYEDLIKKYGIVYHYIACTTSSPRSLIVKDPDIKGDIYWVKPSLHKKLDGSVRLNFEEKLHRAVIMSEALAAIPQKDLDAQGLSFMFEPAAFQAPGSLFGTIIREVNPELLKPDAGKSWLPAFALNADGASGQPILLEMIKKSGKKAEEFVREDIIRTLLKKYIWVGVKEGLPGELHVQNFYYELNSRGIPTGYMVFKDNDGFRFDSEIAMRNGRDLNYLAGFNKPFYWSKFGAAIGMGAEGIPFLGSWFYKLIRNVNGFNTLAGYLLSVLEKIPNSKWDKDRIQKMFDDIALEEIAKLTGVTVPDEARGFGYDKGLNYALNRYRQKLSIAEGGEEAAIPELQKVLAAEYERLGTGDYVGENKRISAERRSVNANTYYLLHVEKDGALVIEARTSKVREANPDPAIGFALLETGDTKEGRRARDRILNAMEGKCQVNLIKKYKAALSLKN